MLLSLLKSISYISCQLIFMFCLSIMALQVTADSMSATDADALEKTVKLLQDQMQRQEMISKNPDAKKADDMAKNIFKDPKDLEKVYRLSAQIFRKLATDKNGDSASMVEALQQAQKNPKNFYKTLDPEQRALIKNLSESVELQNPSHKP